MFSTVKTDLFLNIVSLNPEIDLNDIWENLNLYAPITPDAYYTLLDGSEDCKLTEIGMLRNLLPLYYGQKNKTQIEKICELFRVLLLSPANITNIEKLLRGSIFSGYDYCELFDQVGLALNVSFSASSLLGELKRSGGFDAESISLQDIEEVFNTNCQKASPDLLWTVDELLPYYSVGLRKDSSPSEQLGAVFCCIIRMLFSFDEFFTLYTSPLAVTIHALQRNLGVVFELLSQYGFYVRELNYLYVREVPKTN